MTLAVSDALLRAGPDDGEYLRGIDSTNVGEELRVNRLFGFMPLDELPFMKYLTNLKTLSLVNLRMDPHALNVLLFGLSHCTTLESLDISSNQAGEYLICLPTFASACVSLRSLNVSDNGLTDTIGKPLCEAAGAHPSLVRNSVSGASRFSLPFCSFSSFSVISDDA